MPRLSPKQYYKNYQRLNRFWRNSQPIYGWLSWIEQRNLHDYYRFTEDLTESELQRHRASYSAQYPSLPHMAGKALHRFEEVAAMWVVRHEQIRRDMEHRKHGHGVKRTAKDAKAANIAVRGVLRPDPDYPRLGQAIIEMARAQAVDDEEKQQGGDPKKS